MAILDPIQISAALSDVVTIHGSLSEDFVAHELVDSEGNQIVDSNDNILIALTVPPSVHGILSDVAALESELAIIDTIRGTMAAQETVRGDISIPSSVGGDPYEGSYSVTPSTETQVLNTQYKTMSQNVTINPIPSNYGLITWNGSTITVS